jgi:hypothetical protein
VATTTTEAQAAITRHSLTPRAGAPTDIAHTGTSTSDADAAEAPALVH